MKSMETTVLAPAIWNSLHEELEACNVQLWKDAQELAFRKHLAKGEIVTLFAQNNELSVANTLAKYCQKFNVSESGLRFSVDLYEKFPTLEKIYALPEGESITVRKLRDGYIYQKRDKQPKQYCECVKCGNKHMV